MKAKGIFRAWLMSTWGWYKILTSDQTLRGTRVGSGEAAKADMQSQLFLASLGLVWLSKEWERVMV